MRYVMPLLTQFASCYSSVNLQLVVGDDQLDLLAHGLDMAIHVTSRLDENLVAKQLFISRRVLVASPDYLAKKGVPFHPRELISHTCIGSQPQEKWPFIIEGTMQEFPARSQFTSTDTQAQRCAAEAGLGVAYLPDFIVHDSLESNKLVRLLSSVTKAEQAVCLVCPGPRHISHQVRALADFLITHFVDIEQKLSN
jgi:DNA-binding transcriptional LysR family regulator